MPLDWRTAHAPPGWAERRLVDAVAFPSGQMDPRQEPYRSMTLVAPDHIESGTGRLLARVSAGEQGAISGKYLFQPGDVVYSKIRPYLRKVVRPDFSGLCSADMYPLRAEHGLDSRFLLHMLLSQHFSRFAEIVSMRSGFPKINRNEFGEYTAALPPLPEQRQIAEILDTLDEAIRKTEAIIAKLKQVKQGLLHDLLTRGIDDNGELRDPERHPEQFKDSPLGRIPKQWEPQRLMHLVSLPSGQLDPRVQPYRDWTLVAPDHIESGTGRLISTHTAAEQNAISGKYGFQDGDVVYSKIRPYLRKAVLADFQGLCSADMYPLRPGDRINARFLLAVILGERFSRFAETVSMRSGFPKINRQELAEYAFPLPLRCEQDSIANVLTMSDERAATEEAELGKLRLVKQGLMEDLLTGRVRVTNLLKAAAE